MEAREPVVWLWGGGAARRLMWERQSYSRRKEPEVDCGLQRAMQSDG